MKAAWYDRLGPASEVIEVGEQPTPEPGPGEVRVRLAASGINPADVQRRGGGSSYSRQEFPRVIPNSDGAGIVDMVGAGVGQHWIGQRVWLYNGQRLGRWAGTGAEYIALAEGNIALLPPGVSFAEGACLGIPAMTAHRCVFGDGPVAGKTVLVTGGAGSVGSYAIQLAKWNGARVITTVSGPEKAEIARSMGADEIVNYRSEDVAARVTELTGGAGVDRIVDVDFGGNLDASLKVVKLNGAMAIYATNGNTTPTLPVRQLMAKNVRLLFVVLNSIPLPDREAAQRDVNRWLETARTRPVHRIETILPLERIAEGHQLVESGAKTGMVIIQPGSLDARG
jgi:NADPH2:quinone reductase